MTGRASSHRARADSRVPSLRPSWVVPAGLSRPRSVYAREAIAVHGPRRGACPAMRRLARRHPLATPGLDLNFPPFSRLVDGTSCTYCLQSCRFWRRSVTSCSFPPPPEPPRGEGGRPGATAGRLGSVSVTPSAAPQAEATPGTAKVGDSRRDVTVEAPDVRAMSFTDSRRRAEKLAPEAGPRPRPASR